MAALTVEQVLPRESPLNAAIALARLREHAAAIITLALASAWMATFGWLSVVRHLAGGSHAEDLGFTDQVLFNFLEGQWFRTSVYDGATWNTELDLSRIARPDSLLAFHFEPMLLLLIPVYALGGGAIALLIIQAAALAAGAIPAFRIGRHLTGSPAAGVAVAVAYLLSPLGQWAVLADFHTSALAAPLLLLAVERLIVGRSPLQSVLVAALAATAREDVGPAVGLLGVALLLHRLKVGLAFVALGAVATFVAAWVIHAYSGGVSPFAVRYAATDSVAMFGRPAVAEYATTLLLTGAWLGVLSPVALLPAVPNLALNALSSSPWMSAGKAHYSALVLPFVIVSAATGLRILRRHPRFLLTASAALAVTSVLGYIREGAGPFAANYSPATIIPHALTAAAIAGALPKGAAVSASTSLVPHVSHRSRVYVFPTALDAEYVFLDVTSTPAPTSAGDVFLRVQGMLSNGGWTLQTADDGLMVLRRDAAAGLDPPAPVARAVTDASDGQPRLLSAELDPAPDGGVDVDGPRAILRTTWLTNAPVRDGTRLQFLVDLDDGRQLQLWDVADLWWNPPDHWRAGEPTTVALRDLPLRHFKSWQAVWSVT